MALLFSPLFATLHPCLHLTQCGTWLANISDQPHLAYPILKDFTYYSSFSFSCYSFVSRTNLGGDYGSLVVYYLSNTHLFTSTHLLFAGLNTSFFFFFSKLFSKLPLASLSSLTAQSGLTFLTDNHNRHLPPLHPCANPLPSHAPPPSPSPSFVLSDAWKPPCQHLFHLWLPY